MWSEYKFVKQNICGFLYVYFEITRFTVPHVSISGNKNNYFCVIGTFCILRSSYQTLHYSGNNLNYFKQNRKHKFHLK